MNEPPKKRGGAGRGQGRKPLQSSKVKVFPVRLSDGQHEKLQRMGGAKWIRKKIDEEKEE